MTRRPPKENPISRLAAYFIAAALAVVAALAVATSSSANVVPYASKQFDGRRMGNQSWQYQWQVWLPAKWQRVGACETGYGRRPGDWQWNSGTYQGAFGFHYDSWDGFKPVAWWPDSAYEATPWQQYQTALAIHRRYGFSGWGCRDA